MYQDAFTKLKPKEIETLLKTYNPLFEGSVFESAQTTIMAQDIPFYPKHRYLDIADHSCIPPMRRFAIDGPEAQIVLDWSNDPIYKLNKDIPIMLDEEVVCDYIRFFFNHVKGENGRFLIAESIDDIRWREDPPPAARKTIGEMLMPLIIADQNDKGEFTIKATLMFKDSLFECSIDVSINGDVAINDEKLLIEDMPILDDVLGH